MENTFVVKYKAAKIMTVPFIHFQALQGAIGNVSICDRHSNCGWDGLLLAFTVVTFSRPGRPNVPPRPVDDFPVLSASVPLPHSSSASTPLVAESFFHQFYYL